MVSKGLTELPFVVPGAKRTRNLTPHPNCHTRACGYPVRCGPSALSLPSLEYWVARSSRAMTAVTNMAPRSRDALRPSCANRFAQKKRAQGMPGACCTRGLVCKAVDERRTRAYRYSRSIPAFPAQWFDGLCRDLPGERIRLVTVAAGLMADRPGWIDFATGSLAPATGVRTTRFCRTHQRRSSAAP